MKRGYWTLLGFILFSLGALSFILALVGVKLTILKPLDHLGTIASVVIRIIMLLGGIIMMYLSKSDLSDDE